MREADVRKAVDSKELRSFRLDGESKILHEFCLCQGDVRIDIAVVNGHLHGYELKSDSDTLERLPHQIKAYDKVLDFTTLVVGEKHLNEAVEIIPDWWGIVRAKEVNGRTYTKVIRQAKENPHVDLFSLAQLLWRREALLTLEAHGLDKGMKSKPRKELWEKLARHFTRKELSHIVRNAIKHRPDRTTVKPLRRNDDSFRPLPKLFDSQSYKHA
ncbi:MAG: sce7726 family protein [Desulfovibrionaceae bacterium]